MISETSESHAMNVSSGNLGSEAKPGMDEKNILDGKITGKTVNQSA